MTLKTTIFRVDIDENQGHLWFRNDASRIVDTNYWDLPIAKTGLCYLSGFAGDWRLLLPSVHQQAVQEFSFVKRALIELSNRISGHIDIVALDGSQERIVFASTKP